MERVYETQCRRIHETSWQLKSSFTADEVVLGQTQYLLEGHHRQQTELGEIATELMSLLESAGVSATGGPDNHSVGSPPG